jgi:hypothetical protein
MVDHHQAGLIRGEKLGQHCMIQKERVLLPHEFLRSLTVLVFSSRRRK